MPQPIEDHLTVTEVKSSAWTRNERGDVGLIEQVAHLVSSTGHVSIEIREVAAKPTPYLIGQLFLLRRSDEPFSFDLPTIDLNPEA